jgi:hypothetical protein
MRYQLVRTQTGWYPTSERMLRLDADTRGSAGHVGVSVGVQ